MKYKKLVLFSIFGFSMCVLPSCEQDNKNNPDMGQGNFDLSLKADSDVIPVLRSSADDKSDTPQADDFAITLTNEDGSYTKSWSSINNLPTNGSYDVGNYTIEATYGKLEEEGFDTPYYYGKSDFSIRDQETTEVEVLCTLGHVKLSLQYTEAFTKYFTDYQTTITTAGGKDILFDKDESRAVYVQPGNISMKMKLTKPNGITANYAPAKITNAQAREHYIVTFDVTESVGAALLTVVFDNQTEVEPITIDVSDEAMVAPAPYINLEGVTAGGSIEVQECEQSDNALGASIIARGGVAGCTLKTNSPHLQSLGFPAEVELCELTSEQLLLMENLGMEVKGFGSNRDKMAFLNFTTFTPSLQITADGTDRHSFTLTARDSNGKISEPVTFTIINTPLTLNLGNIGNVMLGSTTIDMPVTFNGKEISRLQVLCQTSSGMKEVPYSIVSNDGNNYLLRANVDVENKPQTLQLNYAGRRTTDTQEVGITVPKYSIKCNDYDVWTTRATMRLIAEDAAYQDIIEKYILFYVNESGTWKEISPEYTSRGYNITGLTAGKSYTFRGACLADQSDIQQNDALNITTEAMASLPNSDFESWTAWFAQTINKGGKYGKIAGTTQETTTLSSSNPNGWVTVNSKTIPTSPTTKNTWYMVPSTLPATGMNGNAALLRNVAWDNNGSTPPSGTWGVSQSLSSLSAPSIANRSAGKMFLGTYSYNHATGTEIYEEGMAFTSRPSKLTGYYKYIAKGGDTNGTVTISVEHRTSSGSAITLATRTMALYPASNYTYFEVALPYTNVQYKATHIKVMFTSSNNASKSQNSETANIKTIDNRSEAVSLGSELYIDNISLTY